MNFSNYFEHPSDNRYMVYRFRDPEHAANFQARLEQESVPFERHEEEERDVLYIFYGVSKDYLKAANRANHLTLGEFRDKFIPNNAFRWAVVIVGLAIIAFAILSAIMNDL
ncbi:MAG: hypothetical protein ACON34_06685 [Flavobacteriales bacterium]